MSYCTTWAAPDSLAGLCFNRCKASQEWHFWPFVTCFGVFASLPQIRCETKGELYWFPSSTHTHTCTHTYTHSSHSDAFKPFTECRILMEADMHIKWQEMKPQDWLHSYQAPHSHKQNSHNDQCSIYTEPNRAPFTQWPFCLLKWNYCTGVCYDPILLPSKGS